MQDVNATVAVINIGRRSRCGVPDFFSLFLTLTSHSDGPRFSKSRIPGPTCKKLVFHQDESMSAFSLIYFPK